MKRCMVLFVSDRCLTIIAIIVPFLFSCHLSSDFSGTATETTNGKVIGSGGKPVAFAKVRLIDASQWLSKTTAGTSVVVDSAVTDSNGRFVIEVPRSYSTNMQIDGDREGVFVSDIFPISVPLPCTTALTLKPYASLSGTLSSGSTNPQELFLSGSVCRSLIGADNIFEARAVPEGEYAVIVRQQSPLAPKAALAGAFTVIAGQSVNTGTISADADRIPVDDFSQGRLRTMLGRVIGGGWWYTFLDTGEFQGNSFINVVNQSVGAFNGKSLQTKVCLGNAISYPFGGTGFNIGDPNSTGYDLSSMTKLSFQAKGRGKINISFRSFMLEKMPGNSDQFNTMLSLPSGWTKIEIPVDSLKISSTSVAAQAGVKWKDASKSIILVQFSVTHHFTTVGDTIEYWFDDIAFEGIGIGSLNRR